MGLVLLPTRLKTCMSVLSCLIRNDFPKTNARLYILLLDLHQETKLVFAHSSSPKGRAVESKDWSLSGVIGENHSGYLTYLNYYLREDVAQTCSIMFSPRPQATKQWGFSHWRSVSFNDFHFVTKYVQAFPVCYRMVKGPEVTASACQSFSEIWWYAVLQKNS